MSNATVLSDIRHTLHRCIKSDVISKHSSNVHIYTNKLSAKMVVTCILVVQFGIEQFYYSSVLRWGIRSNTANYGLTYTC